MKPILNTKFFLLILFLSSVVLATPVGRHGHLQVSGNKITGSNHGDPVMLMGMSHYWSIWGPERFYTSEVGTWLVEDWRINVIRAAIAVEVNQNPGNFLGWIFNRTGQTQFAETVIEAAIANGIYVILDFHTHNAEDFTEEAKEFFGYFAQKYGHHPNLIWEIYNEPRDTPWPEIKSYAEEVISVIRQHSDGLVVVGTRTWSQQVAEAADDPLSDPNVAYTLHFYSGSHTQWLRDRADYALERGVALFITEWGTSTADGGRSDPRVYTAESDLWIDWAVRNQVGMANWSIAPFSETSAALQSHASEYGGWDPVNDLSASGRYVRGKIREINATEDFGPDLVRGVSLNLEIIGSGTVTRSPTASLLDSGTTITLQAIPNPGFIFAGWSGASSSSNPNISIVLNTSQSLTATFTPDPNRPILRNGNFSEGSAYWNFNQFEEGAGALTTTNNQANITINDPGSAIWHTQLVQSGIVLVGGETYRLRFTTQSSEAPAINIAIGMDQGPWEKYFTEQIQVDNGINEWEFIFTQTMDDYNARIEFNLGNAGSYDLIIDNVQLEQGGTNPVNSLLQPQQRDPFLHTRVFYDDGKIWIQTGEKKKFVNIQGH
jgi:endoglucanase